MLFFGIPVCAHCHLSASGPDLMSGGFAERCNIGVVGAGNVGLVTGACFSHLGHRVTSMDKDEERIRGLKPGWMPVCEPGLEELVSRDVRRERLSFASPDGLAGLVQKAAVIL